jgi:hypothetical protein
MYILTCTHPQIRTGASSGYNPNSYRRSQIERSVRLEPVNKTVPGDDGSSTHHLAGDSDGDDRRSVCDLESRTIDRLRPAGNKYTSDITGQGGGGTRSSFDGILVKKQTIIHVGSE